MTCELEGCILHSGSKDILPMSVLENAAFVCALHAARGNVVATAKLLGLGRATVYRMKADHDRRIAESKG